MIYSEATQFCVRKVYDICNDSIANNKSENETKDKIRKVLGIFGTSFQNTLVRNYTDIISEIKKSSVIFYPDYKGLFRFSKACTTLMRNVFYNYKKMLLDEDFLTKIFYGEIVKEKVKMDSYEHFQKLILDGVISVLEVNRIKYSQKDVDCLLELIEIVYSSHIELSAKDWRKLARENRKVTLQSYKDITTVTGDLREAEKCFRTILDHDSSMRYSALVQTIEITNT